MLISPSKIHFTLTSLLSPSSSIGPHTALLIYPNGHLVSSACVDESSTDDDQDQVEDQDGTAEDEDEDEDEDEEPYLERQERTRLLLGLASQWARDDSGKIECELGRLHFTYIALPPSDPVSSIGKESLPSVKPQNVDGFVLVLNATKEVDWKVLISKSDEFVDKWK
ncbi:hypothetical protein I203_103152 [Kwoniella mangroviensis CBS 8507]|uniref:uncharacterized protein n=1 Tax=Kwoniella mangroviensis CBS 8507 TaxID=1296122 RepID=UPI00080D4708|nr:uncharacterized protein I203_07475 [Kwoniella mangroviensis CBS 8507]OCF63407.1 hypothetical protein I203_07475 [Kwoniella mangroviensis CBS 8507]